MISKKGIKLFGLALGINFVTYILQNFFVGISFNDIFTRNFLIITILVSVVETLILDKWVIQGGIVNGE